MEFRKLRRRALTALCASAAFTPAAAWAQSDSDGAVSPDDGTIIVTAQKREQRLQDVPVSVTALGSAQLEAAGIDSGTEIARQTPNLRVSVLGDESQPKFAIRGISTPEFNLNAISPTGVFYDEVYVGSSFLGGAQIFDIERVEVLRGPQGTLFGKNTTARSASVMANMVTPKSRAPARRR